MVKVVGGGREKECLCKVRRTRLMKRRAEDEVEKVGCCGRGHKRNGETRKKKISTYENEVREREK